MEINLFFVMSTNKRRANLFSAHFFMTYFLPFIVFMVKEEEDMNLKVILFSFEFENFFGKGINFYFGEIIL